MGEVLMLQRASRKKFTMKNRNFESLETRRLMAASNYTVIDLGEAPGNGSFKVEDVAGQFYAGTRTVNGKSQGYLARIGTRDYVALKPITNADFSVVLAIRANGDAVGYSYAAGNPSNTRATLWSGGQVIDLGAGKASAISSNGIIVGTSAGQAALFNTAAPVVLGAITNGNLSAAGGVNNAGRIVGQSGNVAFSYQNGSFFDLSFQGAGTNGVAYAINDAGTVVGQINNHPFFTTGLNVVQYLNERNGSGFAYDINASGNIVGVTGSTHGATLWEGTTPNTLNNLVTNLNSWDLQTATDISDDGRIVGYGTLDGDQHAYLLVPGGTFLNSKGTMSIIGTSGDDSITVSVKNGRFRVSLNESLVTFSPKKVKRLSISSFEGNDVVTLGSGVIGAGIDGGAGNDTISGGDNSDNLFGGTGNDKLTGYGSRDSLRGGDGNDTLLGGSSIDTLDGGNGNDKSDFDQREKRKNIEGLV
jgi:probable HAF family extracellular repeat protein